jgi:hypothetical protein
MNPKRTRVDIPPLRIATAENAAAVDKNPPLSILLQAVQDGLNSPEKGGCVTFWMRMGDLRSRILFLIARLEADTVSFRQQSVGTGI